MKGRDRLIVKSADFVTLQDPCQNMNNCLKSGFLLAKHTALFLTSKATTSTLEVAFPDSLRVRVET